MSEGSVVREGGETTGRKRSTGWSILIGCAVALVVSLMLVVGACVAFFSWVTRPGELLQGNRLLGPETEGYVEWTFRLEDPGTREAVDSMLAKLQKLQARSAPGDAGNVVRWIQESSRRRNEQQILELFPAILVWSLEPGADGGPEHVFALNFRSGGNRIVLLDWILRRLLWSRERRSMEAYRDEQLYLVGKEDGAAFFLREGSIYVATSPNAARNAVDRLAAANPGGSSALAELLAHVPVDRPLRGVMRNEHGEVGLVLEALGASRTTSEEIERLVTSMRNVRIAGGFDANQALAGEILFDCEGPTCPSRPSDLTAHASGEGESSFLRLAETRPGGGRLDFRVEDPVGTLVSRLEAALRKLEKHAPARDEEEVSEP